jgi:hypothetical protein
MKTFYDFIKDRKIQSANSEINEYAGLVGAIPRVASMAGNTFKSLGKYLPSIGAGASIAASAAKDVAVDALSKSLLDADDESEVEEILTTKIKEAEKLLKNKLETHFKNFSINLSTNLNKIIKTNMEEFKKKIDTALIDFIA